MNARIRRIIGAVAVAGLMTGATACGNLAQQGRSPSLLVIDGLDAASGASPGESGVPLLSDVQTMVLGNPTFFNDVGEARLRIVLKDQGNPTASSAPSPFNAVTITRYHVSYRRADGRNVPGVDVPYPMDGSVTVTVTASTTVVPFEIVRAQAKLESPLRPLVGLGGRIVISTIADVTFYGQDLAGNDVQVTGSMSVNFADWADPA